MKYRKAAVPFATQKEAFALTRIFAPALTLIAERVAMTVMMNMGQDGLKAQQRAEVFCRQMIIARDRLEMMHANLQIIAPEDQDDIEKALALRLDASELAATDRVIRAASRDEDLRPGIVPYVLFIDIVRKLAPFF